MNRGVVRWNKLSQSLAVLFIIVSGAGGIMTGTYPVLGTCLVIAGIVWQIFSHVSTERRNQFVDQMIEAQNTLLAQAGAGSPYVQIVQREFRETGYCRDAIKYLRKALNNNPDDLEALKLYVIIMSLNFSMRHWVKGIIYGPQNEEWQYVYKKAETGYKKHPTNFVLPAALGILLDLAEQHELARKMFRKSGELRTDPFWHVHLSVSYGMSGCYDVAAKELEMAITKGIHGRIIEYHCAALHLDLGNYDLALKHVRAAFKLGGTIPQLRKIEEECLFADGRLFASAWSKIKLAWQLVLLNPKRSFLLLFGACVHSVIMIIVTFSKKLWPLTSRIPVVNKFQYKYLSPNQPELAVGSDLMRKGHFGKAKELFERCIKLNPRDVEVLLKLAHCHARMGNVDEALKAYNITTELKLDSAEIWNDKGVLLRELHCPAEALKAYDKAIELKPDSAETWYNKGNLLSEHQPDEAIKAYDKAIELKPDFAEAWCSKGHLLIEHQPDEAPKALDKAINLKPDFVEAWINRFNVFHRSDRPDKALMALNKVIELRPDYAFAWYNRACIYSVKGNKEKALSNLREAIEIDMSYKKEATQDVDFKNLWNDKDFKKIVS